MTPAAKALLTRRTAVVWLCWLLAMLLVFDQVSAPLHRHHHDNGIDAVGLSAGRPHAIDAGAPQLDADDPLPGGFHGVSAVRTASRAAAEPVSTVRDDDRGIAAGLPQPWLAAPVAAPGVQAAAAADGPARPVPLSLPPEGRAPPVRA